MKGKTDSILIKLVMGFFILLPGLALAEDLVVEVFKSATCSCCTKWVAHLEEAGFKVNAKNVDNVASYKTSNKIPRQLGSCHTALVGGYVVEGHVPAEDIKKLLKERPDVIGIAAPGMPLGSPGMEAPNPQSYAVMAFDENGNVSQFAYHTAEEAVR
jgi:hypothetical protein